MIALAGSWIDHTYIRDGHSDTLADLDKRRLRCTYTDESCPDNLALDAVLTQYHQHGLQAQTSNFDTDQRTKKCKIHHHGHYCVDCPRGQYNLQPTAAARQLDPLTRWYLQWQSEEPFTTLACHSSVLQPSSDGPRGLGQESRILEEEKETKRS